jgi:hypothetical protein
LVEIINGHEIMFCIRIDDFDKAIMDLAKSLELNPSDRMALALKELIEHN